MRRPAAFAVAMVALVGAARAQTLHLQLCGEFGAGGGASFGLFPSGVGDFDGDGTPDVMVGEILGYYPPASLGHVISGADGSELAEVRGMHGLATALGDVDGDGAAELIVSNGLWAPNTVMVVSGADVSKALYVLGGPSGIELVSGWLGYSLDAAGDLTGDGIPDFVVGQPAYNVTFYNQGAVHLVSGRDGQVVQSWMGSQSFDFLGRSVAALGDVNADGIGDLAYCGGKPVVYVVSGADGSPLLTIAEPDPQYYDTCVAAPGDVDGDGVADVAVGMRHASPYVPVSTAVTRMHSGATGSLIWEGQGSSELLVVLGDVDGDGIAEVASRGQHFVPATGESPRQVQVFSGADGTLLYRLQGDSVHAESLAGVGDLDGDGRADLVIGSDAAESCVRFVSLRPPGLLSSSPDALQAAAFAGAVVITLEVDDATYIETAHIDGLPVPAEAIGPTTVRVTLPAPTHVGPVQIRVSNIGYAPSEALTLQVLATHPPVLQAPPFGFTAEPLAWTLWGAPGDEGLVLAALDSSTTTIAGWPVLAPAATLGGVTLDAVGKGGVTLPFLLPPALVGLVISSQLATFDGATGTLAGTSALAGTFIAY